VLEHVERSKFSEIVRHMRRVMKKGAYCSHRIDLKDHLGGSLNNLRFSERLWESEFMATSGFYTNRLRASEILQTFHEADFRVASQSDITWNSLPILQSKLASPFRDFDESDLRISGMDLVLEAI